MLCLWLSRSWLIFCSALKGRCLERNYFYQRSETSKSSPFSLLVLWISLIFWVLSSRFHLSLKNSHPPTPLFNYLCFFLFFSCLFFHWLFYLFPPTVPGWQNQRVLLIRYLREPGYCIYWLHLILFSMSLFLSTWVSGKPLSGYKFITKNNFV